MPLPSEHDRILFLSSPEPGELRALSQRLNHGLIVVLGSAEEVSEGRCEHSDLENVMFVPASAEDIPWRDGFFDRVLDPREQWTASEKAAAESARVSRRDN